MGQKQKKEKREGATGLGRKTREQIEKWHQMTALKFHRGRHQKCLASFWGLLNETVRGTLHCANRSHFQATN